MFTAQGRKFKFSAQENNSAHFVANGIKVKIPSEIKPPLMKTQTYKFIIQLHKNVFPKPNVKISMHATKHYKLHVICVTVTARKFTKHKRKVIRLLNYSVCKHLFVFTLNPNIFHLSLRFIQILPRFLKSSLLSDFI